MSEPWRHWALPLTVCLVGMLLPKAKAKLPEPWRLQWARQRSATAGLAEFLGFLDNDLSIREEASLGQQGRRVPSERLAVPTVSALAVSQNQTLPTGVDWKCMACKRFKHGLGTCSVY